MDDLRGHGVVFQAKYHIQDTPYSLLLRNVYDWLAPQGSVAYAAEAPASTPTRTYTGGGNKEAWMAAAGIPQSEWWAVDSIVSRESSWNPNAVNASSGACGLAQALPCSKMGPNWSDPVVALKWQYNYVNARYGGYPQAVAFWNINHWY